MAGNTRPRALSSLGTHRTPSFGTVVLVPWLGDGPSRRPPSILERTSQVTVSVARIYTGIPRPAARTTSPLGTSGGMNVAKIRPI